MISSPPYLLPDGPGHDVPQAAVAGELLCRWEGGVELELLHPLLLLLLNNTEKFLSKYLSLLFPCLHMQSDIFKTNDFQLHNTEYVS
jgi:hypothetical protein